MMNVISSTLMERDTIRPLQERRCWCGGSLNETDISNFLQCGTCGTFVVRDYPEKEKLQNLYEQEYWKTLPKAFDYPTIQERAETDFNDRIPVWYKVLELFSPPPARILEIGCGHGGFLAYAKDRGYEQVVGIEPDPKVAEFGRGKFKLKHLLSGFFPDVELPHQDYDVVAAFDVLEHLLDPAGCLKAIHGLLRNDGVLILQTPCYRNEGRDWEQFAPEHNHIYIFNRESVELLFQKAGFRVEASLPGYFLHDVIFVATKQTGPKGRQESRFSSVSFQSKLQSLFMEITDIRENNEYALMRDRDAWVQRAREYERQSIDKENEIRKVSEEAETRLAEMQKMALELQKKDDELRKVSQEAQARLVEMRKMASSLEEKDAAIKRVAQEAEVRLVEMQKMAKALEEKEKEITNLKSIAEERLKQMEEKEKLLQSLGAELELSTDETQRMKDQVDNKEKELRKLILDIAVLKENWGYRFATRLRRLTHGSSRNES